MKTFTSRTDWEQYDTTLEKVVVTLEKSGYDKIVEFSAPNYTSLNLRGPDDRNISVKDFYHTVDQYAAWDLLEPWDPAGFQLGSMNAKVSSVLLTLDLTKSCVEWAKLNSIDLIITHHPVLFKPCQALTDNTIESSLLLELAANRIALISAHTNLDATYLGTGFAMASVFTGILDCRQILSRLEILQKFRDRPGLGHGRILFFDQSLSFGQVVGNLANKFAQPHPIARPGYGRNWNADVRSIVFCPGAFPDEALSLARESGCEMIVTGEVKHHQSLAVHDSGLDLVQLGHDVSERVVLPYLLAYLLIRYPEISFALDPGIDYTLGNSN